MIGRPSALIREWLRKCLNPALERQYAEPLACVEETETNGYYKLTALYEGSLHLAGVKRPRYMITVYEKRLCVTVPNGKTDIFLFEGNTVQTGEFTGRKWLYLADPEFFSSFSYYLLRTLKHCSNGSEPKKRK